MPTPMRAWAGHGLARLDRRGGHRLVEMAGLASVGLAICRPRPFADSACSTAIAKAVAIVACSPCNLMVRSPGVHRRSASSPRSSTGPLDKASARTPAWSGVLHYIGFDDLRAGAGGRNLGPLHPGGCWPAIVLSEQREGPGQRGASSTAHPRSPAGADRVADYGQGHLRSWRMTAVPPVFSRIRRAAAPWMAQWPPSLHRDVLWAWAPDGASVLNRRLGARTVVPACPGCRYSAS